MWMPIKKLTGNGSFRQIIIELKLNNIFITDLLLISDTRTEHFMPLYHLALITTKPSFHTNNN